MHNMAGSKSNICCANILQTHSTEHAAHHKLDRCWDEVQQSQQSAPSRGRENLGQWVRSNELQPRNRNFPQPRNRICPDRSASGNDAPPKENIVSDTETTHVDLANELDHHIYHRFNVAQGLEDVQLFEHEKIEAIEIDTKNYLEQHTKQVTDCVKLMAQLPINACLLARGKDSAPVFVTSTSEQNEDAALMNRLKELRM
jgi:hypothetical protein